ncbi:AIR synthase related protein [Brassicibacter mesophilus]|uniref:AIR synthase related protein n=1 Tax=Brassicibacter mesophilus TaxID=745119 RepID=UPI003D219032
MKISKFRDLTLIDINKDQILVISCDSCGGIGEKERDIVNAPPDIVGYFTTQVALSEVLAVGATPVTVVNTLAVEMNDTGKKIIDGVKKALQPLCFDENDIITGSTEENFPVCQTAMGITIIGIADKKNWKIPTTKSEELAVVVGIPKVGNDVLEDGGKEILSIPILQQLVSNSDVSEILPVGSKGILYELEQLAATNNLSFELFDNLVVDIKKSAGPATCAICSINQRYFDRFRASIGIPVNIIGRFA